MNPFFFYKQGENKYFLKKNLTAYYSLNGNAIDSTGLCPTGTTTSITYVTGIQNNAANFTTSTSKIDIADTNNLSFTDGTNDIPFSISVWVYFTAINTTGNWFINKRGNTSGTDEWQVYFDSNVNSFRFTKFDKTSNSISQGLGFSITPTLNTWYNIICTDDGTKTFNGMSFYLNGVKRSCLDRSSGVYTGLINSNAVTTLGAPAWGSGALLVHQGYLDEIGIWKNRVLTPTEVGHIYYSGSGRFYPFNT